MLLIAEITFWCQGLPPLKYREIYLFDETDFT